MWKRILVPEINSDLTYNFWQLWKNEIFSDESKTSEEKESSQTLIHDILSDDFVKWIYKE